VFRLNRGVTCQITKPLGSNLTHCLKRRSDAHIDPSQLSDLVYSFSMQAVQPSQVSRHKPFRCVVCITVARDPGNASGYSPLYQHPTGIAFVPAEHALSLSSQLLELLVS